MTTDLRSRLQQQCTQWGVYWRAPDAHGVGLTIDQAAELLRDALGVEVEIAAAPSSPSAPAEPAAQGGERGHATCRMCGGTGAGGGGSEWCTHCGATGREPSKVDEQTLMALWDETATRDDRVLAFGFAVAEHVALVCRMDGA